MPGGVPYNVDFAPLFSDNTTLYFYNPADTSSETIWTYNVSTESWKDIPVASASANPAAPSTGGWTSNAVAGKSFYLGTPDSALARRDLVSRDIASPGLQMLDTSVIPAKWTLDTAGAPLLSAAEMVYVRSGGAGVLIAFGGVDPNDHSEFSSNTLGTYRDMSQIFVYDIASGTWFNVTATGDVPVGRINMCAGVSAAPDDSSFQITIYGGYNLRFGNPANDMYVLSVPSFQWINVTPQDADPYGRWEHSCAVWNDAQMIVLGGLMKESTGNGAIVNANGCNASHPPLAIIDTTQFTFQTQFNPQRSYSVPQAVYNVIGGDYRGLSSMKGPKAGFNNSQLTAIFSKTVPREQQPTSFPLVPTATASNTSNADASALPSGSSGGLSTPAIAGIAAGGAAVLILLIAVIVTCLVKRRRRRVAAQGHDVTGHFEKAELPSSTWSDMAEPRLTQQVRQANFYHEADSNDRVFNEADEGIVRVAELNATEPQEAEGRELSTEEAQAFLEKRESRREAREERPKIFNGF